MSDKRSWNDTLELEKRRAAPAAADHVVNLFPLGGDTALLGGLGADYKAAAVPDSGNIVRLWIILGKKESSKPGGKRHWGFLYVHLASGFTIGYDDDGMVFTCRFTGPDPMTIVIRGRNLMAICDYISLHRMGWIRVGDEELSPDEAVDDKGQPVPFITSITISDTATGEVLAGG